MPDTAALPQQRRHDDPSPPDANPPLEYRDLAWWPEKLDGAEGKDLVLAFIKAEKRVVLETEDEAKQPGHKTILKGIKGPKAAPKKEKRVLRILVEVEGEVKDGKQEPPKQIPAMIDGVVCDSVFTSPSAIRKFVLLYYDAQGLLDKSQRDKLEKMMDDPKVSAIGHIHPSAHAAIETGSDLWLWVNKKVGGQIVEDWVSLDKYEPSE